MRNWRLELFPYLSATWQYRWYGLAAAWVVCVLGWLSLAIVPNTYQSRAEVYIDTHTLLRPLLQGLAVTTDPNSEIQVMLQALLTDPTLESVIRATSPKAASSMSSSQIQNAVAQLRKKISLTNLQAKDVYSIAYTDRDPAHAQSVAQTLVSVLIDSSLGGQRRDADQAGAFLDSQIAKYEQKLEAADKRRADFKTANIDFFSTGPDGDKVGGAGDVVAAQTAVAHAQHTLDEAVDRRNSLRTQLAATSKTLSVNEPLPATMEREGTAISPRTQLAAAIAKLNMLRMQFTDSYPDVVMQKRLIRRLESQQSAESGTKGISNPVYVMLMTKVADAEGEVAVDRNQLEYAKKRLEQAKALTAKAISIQREYQDLDRDYQVLHTNYETLVSRRESANITQAAGNQQSAFVFRVISPPMKPQIPVAPNRFLLNAAVLLLGIGAGAVLAFGLGQFSGRFLSMEQLKEAFELPILGAITTVRTGPDRVAAGRSTAFFAAGLGMLVASCLIVLFFFHTGNPGLSL